MLSYALAIAVGISSLVLFFTAFVLSDVHRQDDFLWSGVGLFYALVLWFCASNITGAVLLGQGAASALIVSYSWQNLKLRRAIAHPESATSTRSSKFSWLKKLPGLGKPKSPPVKPENKTTKANPNPPAVNQPKVTEEEITIPDAISVKTAATAPSPPATTETVPSNIEQTEVNHKPTSEASPAVATASVDDSPATEPQAKVEASPAAEPQSESEVSEVTQPQESTNPIAETEELNESHASSEATAAEAEMKTEESAIENTSPPDIVTPENRDPQKDPKSMLDSLETVEVAEILEAVPEERDGNRDRDRANVIDVTTTDVDSVSQVSSPESSPEDNYNSDQDQPK